MCVLHTIGVNPFGEDESVASRTLVVRPDCHRVLVIMPTSLIGQAMFNPCETVAADNTNYTHTHKKTATRRATCLRCYFDFKAKTINGATIAQETFHANSRCTFIFFIFYRVRAL